MDNNLELLKWIIIRSSHSNNRKSLKLPTSLNEHLHRSGGTIRELVLEEKRENGVWWNGLWVVDVGNLMGHDGAGLPRGSILRLEVPEVEEVAGATRGTQTQSREVYWLPEVRKKRWWCWWYCLRIWWPVAWTLRVIANVARLDEVTRPAVVGARGCVVTSSGAIATAQLRWWLHKSWRAWWYRWGTSWCLKVR